MNHKSDEFSLECGYIEGNPPLSIQREHKHYEADPLKWIFRESVFTLLTRHFETTKTENLPMKLQECFMKLF